MDKGTVIDEGDSEEFNVINSLKGKFNVDKTRVQVGENVEIKGEVFKLNGEGVNGSAQIYLNSESSGKYLVDVVSVVDGVLNYNYVLDPGESDVYKIDVLVNDVYGNEELFEEISEFVLVNELVVSAEVNKFRAGPGDKIEVSGEVETLMGEDVDEGSVEISLSGDVYHASLREDGLFESEFKLSEKVRSGKQMINVVVVDALGNVGEAKVELYIEAVASDLINELNGDSFIPGDKIEVTPLFYDQAGDLVIKDISVDIKNPKGKKVFSDVVRTNNVVKFMLPDYALPGGWEIISFADDSETRTLVTVEEYVKLDIELDNQTLIVKNVGNVEFKDPLKIEAGEYSIVKNDDIKVEGVIEVYLDEELPSGDYLIVARYKDEEVVFDNVGIYGRSRRNLNLIYLVIVFVLVGVLGYLTYIKSKGKVKKRREKVHHKKSEEHHEKHIVHKEKPAKKTNRWKSDEKDVEDFKERILRDIRKVEDKPLRKKGEFRFNVPKSPKEDRFKVSDLPKKEEKKEEPKSGIFSMFD